MAIENMFIASSITSGILMLSFIFLFYIQKGELFKTVWLAAFFIMATYEITIERFGFLTVDGIAQFDSLTAYIMQAVDICMIIICFFFLLQLLLYVVNLFFKILTGENLLKGSLYGDPEKEN